MNINKEILKKVEQILASKPEYEMVNPCTAEGCEKGYVYVGSKNEKVECVVCEGKGHTSAPYVPDTSKFDEVSQQLTAMNTKIDNLSDMINRMLSLKKVDDTPRKEKNSFFDKLFKKD